MTRDPATVGPDTNLADAVDVMEAHGVRHLPVVQDGRLVGLLSERNVRDALPSLLTLHDPAARRRFLAASRVSHVWIPNPESVSPDATVLDAIAVVRRLRAGSLPVVEDGRVVGILTSGDLVNLLERMLRQG